MECEIVGVPYEEEALRILVYLHVVLCAEEH
jgi:hypothetical protein